MELGSPTANRLYTAALDAARPDDSIGVAAGGEETSESFIDALTDGAQETVQTIANSEYMTSEMMAGRADAHSVVEALAAAEMALEMAVAVRNKVVEAYQEILRMPV